MHRKLIASGVILLIVGILMVIFPEQDKIPLEHLLFIIIGHVIGAIGIILVVVGLGTIVADRL
jgi:hypothetical protein